MGTLLSVFGGLQRFLFRTDNKKALSPEKQRFLVI